MTAPSAKLKELRRVAQNDAMLTTIEAAEMTGYAADHISLLLRRGILRGKRKGRDWFIDAGSLLEYVNAKPKPGPRKS